MLPVPQLRLGESLDLWMKISNDVIVEAHRSDEFLEAQRRMTRSATICMPVLNVFAQDDHIIPPKSSQALKNRVGSEELQRALAARRPRGRVGERQVARNSRQRHRRLVAQALVISVAAYHLTVVG